MRSSAGLCVLSCLFAVGAAAQQPVTVAAPAPRSMPQKPLVIPPGELSIAQLVETVSRVAKRNILCEERELANARPIVLTEPLELDPATSEDLLWSLLHTRDLGLVPVDRAHGVYEVRALAGPHGQEVMNAAETRTAEEILAHPDSRRPVTITVALKHLNPPMVVNGLRPMFGQPGSSLAFGAVGPQGIMLRGWQNEVAAALRIIQENDKMPAAGAGPAMTAAGPRPGGAPPAGPELVARIAALEKQVEELKREVQKLRLPAGK